MVILETSCTEWCCIDDNFAFISKVGSIPRTVCFFEFLKTVSEIISRLKDSSLKCWIACQTVQTCLNGERLKQQLREGRQGAGCMLADYLSNAWGVWSRVGVRVFLVLVHVHTSRRNVPPAGSCQLLSNDRYGADTPRYDSWDLCCGSVSFHASHKSTQNKNKMAGEDRKVCREKKYRISLEKVLK